MSLVAYDEGVPRDVGPTAKAVSENLKRLLKARRLSARGFAAEMVDGPGRLTHSAISEVMRGARRVDTDELTALAAALGVSPVTLLMPTAPDEDADFWSYPREPDKGDTPHGRDFTVELTGVGPMSATAALSWLRGDSPAVEHEADLDGFDAQQFRRHALPWWAWFWYRDREG